MNHTSEPKTLILDVRMALGGNQKSYGAIYEYLAPILRKAIKRKVFGIQPHLVQDILQDVFVKLFSNLNSYRNCRSFTSWAISIAVHHVIDLSRKRKPDVILSENVEIYDSGVSESLDESFQYGTVPVVDVFDLSNKYLDNTSKHIIIGKYSTGLKQKELAEKLNKPIGSISGLQLQAIEQLRKKVIELRYERCNFL